MIFSLHLVQIQTILGKDQNPLYTNFYTFIHNHFIQFNDDH